MSTSRVSASAAPDPYAIVEREFASSGLPEDIQSLSERQCERLRQYWVDRADGELTTALSFEFMLEDLKHLQAPTEICALAERAIADEHRHVDWCVRWAERIDPTQPVRAAFRGTRPAAFDGASEHDNRLLRIVFGGCFSETVAVHVLRTSHAHITIPSVRHLNHLHLKEEVGHARLGWAVLGWPGLEKRDRDMLRDHVPELEALTRAVWQSSRRAPDERLHEFGFLSSEIVDAAVDEALSEVILPGLAYLGITSPR